LSFEPQADRPAAAPEMAVCSAASCAKNININRLLFWLIRRRAGAFKSSRRGAEPGLSDQATPEAPMDRHTSLMHKLRPRNLARIAFSCLPRAWRDAFYRRMVHLSEAPIHPTFEVKVAEEQGELAEAFKLLHDEYVRSGLMDPHPSGMRVTPYHALPTTTTLVAKVDGRVIATLSVVKDNVFGLPLDKIFDSSELRRSGARLAEISSLAIAKDWRQNRGAVLWPLLKYLYEYCVRYVGVDYMLIAVAPSHFDFYRAILGFETLGSVESYGFVKGAPATGGYLDTRAAYGYYAGAYGLRKKSKNLFHYFTKSVLPYFKFPLRKFRTSNDPVMTPSMLDYFFNQQTRVFESLSPRERAILRALYDDVDYAAVLPECTVDARLLNARQSPRYDVACVGRLVLGSRTVAIEVVDASKTGFQARLAEPIRFGSSVRADISIAEFDVASLKCKPVWNDERGVYGFTIEEAPPNWERFLRQLRRDLTRDPTVSVVPELIDVAA
jgi:hypothetical protein